MVSIRKRLVLHIGFHQAGSDAVHQSLNGARVALRHRGVLYPQPLSGHPSHLDVATALGFNPRDELESLEPGAVLEHYRQLIDDAAPGTVILLACQEFCLGNFFPEAMQNLQIFREKLNVDLTISAAVREPLGFLVDVYQTELRETDGAADFSQWLDGFDLTGADFDKRLDPWRDLVGPADELAVHEVDADGRATIDRAALDGILADCGLDTTTVPLVRPPGTELHPHLVEPLLAVRRHVDELADRRRLLEALLEVAPLLEPVPDPAAVHLDPATRTELEARLARGGRTSGDEPEPDDDVGAR